MVFFEGSDLFDESEVLGLLPPDYLLKERALLLAKSKQYKEAISLCIT